MNARWSLQRRQSFVPRGTTNTHGRPDAAPKALQKRGKIGHAKARRLWKTVCPHHLRIGKASTYRTKQVGRDTRKDGGDFRKRHATPQTWFVACYLTRQHTHNLWAKNPVSFRASRKALKYLNKKRLFALFLIFVSFSLFYKSSFGQSSRRSCRCHDPLRITFNA